MPERRTTSSFLSLSRGLGTALAMLLLATLVCGAEPKTLDPILAWETSHRISALALSEDGAYVVASGSHGLNTIWDAKTGEKLRFLSGTTDDSTSVAISPDNKWIGVGGIEGAARVFDLASGECRYTLGNHGSRVMQVAFSPDSKLFATSCWDGVIRWWNLSDGKLAGQTEGCRVGLGGLAFSQNPIQLISAWCKRTAELSEKDGPSAKLEPSDGFVFAVRVAPIDSKDILRMQGLTAGIWSVAFDSKEQLFAAGMEDGSVSIWSNAKNEKVAEWRVAGGESVSKQPGIVSLAFLPGRRVFAISMSGEGGVWSIDSGERESIVSRPTDGFVSASVASGAQKVAVATWGQKVEVFDLAP